jgi:hypothetical protein
LAFDINKLPEKVALDAVISPFANIIFAEGTSPTENPATELKGFNAILCIP